MVWVAATETTGVQCPMKVVTDFSSKHFYCFKDPPTIPRLQKCFGAKELKDEQAVVRIERLAQSLDPGRERISAIIDTIPCQRPVATADASTTAAAMLLVREQILVGNDYDVNRSRPFSQRWRDLARSSCGEGDIADDPLPSMAVPVVVEGNEQVTSQEGHFASAGGVWKRLLLLLLRGGICTAIVVVMLRWRRRRLRRRARRGPMGNANPSKYLHRRQIESGVYFALFLHICSMAAAA